MLQQLWKSSLIHMLHKNKKNLFTKCLWISCFLVPTALTHLIKGVFCIKFFYQLFLLLQEHIKCDTCAILNTRCSSRTTNNIENTKFYAWTAFKPFKKSLPVMLLRRNVWISATFLKSTFFVVEKNLNMFTIKILRRSSNKKPREFATLDLNWKV